VEGYQKAAVFIAVLLFSVAMMSTAIDMLGNISDVDLDEEPQSEKRPAGPAGSMDLGKGRGKLIEVEGELGGEIYPLFEITYPPRTKYLRQSVGEIYEDGAWRRYEGHEKVPYNGEELEPDVSGYESLDPVDLTIKPFFNISGFIPVTLSVVFIEFDGDLERYPSMELFWSPNLFKSTYSILYASYNFSRATLNSAQPQTLDYCLEVPKEHSERLEALASEIIGDLSTPWEKLKALEQYLRTEYEYDEEYTPAPYDVDPVENFLFEDGRGVCTHFNSAFVLLARSIGLPARIVRGYLVNPDADFQFVMAKQAHIYAEVPFEGLGWMTFDATPERMEEQPQKFSRIPTVTNITYNDPVGLKGGRFAAHGTVTAYNGSAVDGLSVEVFLKISKNETGVRCARGMVEEGFFNISCEASPSLKVGDYMLVAHTIGDAVYEESWSDPDIKIMTETVVTLQPPGDAYVGDIVILKGKLIDKSNGQPIGGMTVYAEVDGDTYGLTTDGSGTALLSYLFETEGNKTVTFNLLDSEYYLGSEAAVNVAVEVPLPSQPGIIEMLTIFPYNAILVGACTALVGVAVIVAGRRKQPPLTADDEVFETMPPVDEGPLTFDTYKEGVVKLFNRFFAYTKRRHEGIENWMTPREFQRRLMDEIPDKGTFALDELVTAFEIAKYSEAPVAEEDFELCRASVDLLKELMEDGEGGKEENPA